MSLQEMYIKAKHIGQDYQYQICIQMEHMLHSSLYGAVCKFHLHLYMKLHFSHKINQTEVIKQAGNGGFCHM